MKGKRVREAALWIGVAVLTVAASAAWHAGSAGATTQMVTLQSVSSSILADDGLTLNAPSHSGRVSLAAARETVLSQYPEAKAIESPLVSLGSTHVPAVHGHLCWVFSIVPRDGIWASAMPRKGVAGIALGYQLEFVDADTGAWIFAVKGTL